MRKHKNEDFERSVHQKQLVRPTSIPYIQRMQKVFILKPEFINASQPKSMALGHTTLLNSMISMARITPEENDLGQ